MRRELVKWLEKRGHWAILRSSQVPRLSGTVDKETGQPYRIGEGLSTGRPFADYLVKICNTKVVPAYNIDTAIGDAAVGAEHVYLESNNPVKEGDVVLEIELAENGNPITPFKIRKGYKVLEARDMREGAGIVPGRVEFYQCRVENMSVR